MDEPVQVGIRTMNAYPQRASASVPGVSHPEPGGLSVREVPIVGADVVELNPELDARGLTATVAAKLVKEIARLMHRPGCGTAARQDGVTGGNLRAGGW